MSSAPGWQWNCHNLKCNKRMVLTPTQQRVVCDNKLVYCSPECRYAAAEQHTIRCSVCGTVASRTSDDSFEPYLGRLHHYEFCSLECLFEHLINERRLAFPPAAAAPLVPLPHLDAKVVVHDKNVRTSPQNQLYNRLLGAYGQYHWVKEYGLATGLWQDDKPRQYRLDIACAELKIAIECDGDSHLSRSARTADAVRDVMLGQLGWLALRFTYEQIAKEAGWCVEQVGKAIEHRQHLDSLEGLPLASKKRRR